jgi:hypothetical protein
MNTISDSIASQAWLLKGNLGTNPPNNFIGTKDAKDLVFKTNNNERVRIASGTGNVGIGQTLPAEKLDVLGNIKFTGTLNPAGLPGNNNEVLTSTGNTTAPVWKPLSTLLSTSTTTLNNVQIDSSKINYADINILQADTANVNVLNVGGQNIMNTISDSITKQAWLLKGNAGTNPATNFIGTTDNNDLVIRTNNTEKIRVLANGNTGVGTTAAILSKLQVNNVIRIDDDLSTPGSNTFGIGSNLYIGNLSGGGVFQYNATRGLDLWQHNSATIWQQNVTFERDGNVGIGTTTPVTTNVGSTKIDARGEVVAKGRYTLTEYANDPTPGNLSWHMDYLSNRFRIFNQPDVFTGGIQIPFTITNTNNVGINNQTPTEKLDVVGNMKFSQALMPAGNSGTVNQLLVSQGAGVAPQWQGGSLLGGTLNNAAWTLLGNNATNPNTNFIGTTDNNSLRFRTNNTQKMIIDSTGNVGIGINAPVVKLHVEDNDPNHSVNTLSNFSPAFTAIPTLNYHSLWGQTNLASTFSIPTNVYGTVSRVNVSATQTGVMSGFLVGATVDVENYSAASISNAAGLNAQVFHQGTGSITNAYAAKIAIGKPGTGSITNGYGLFIDNIQATNKWSLYANDPTAPSFFSANVGIGTTNPTARLEMFTSGTEGDIKNVTEGGYSGIQAWTYTNGTGKHPYFAGFRANGTKSSPSYPLAGEPLSAYIGRDAIDGSTSGIYGGASMNMVAAQNFSVAAKGTKFEFQTTPNGAVLPITRMTINHDGNVGIGTLSPTVKLEVPNGGAKFSNVQIGGSYTGITQWFGIDYGYESIKSDGGTNLRFVIGTNEVAIIRGTGNMDVLGNLTVNGTFYASDIRFKNNIRNISGALTKLTTLRGVTYDYNQEYKTKRNFDKSHQLGVIAQEVETVFPELVITAEDGYKAVDYAKFAPIFIEAIKELDAKHKQELEAQKTQHNEQLNTLLKRIEALEKNKLML